MYVVAGEVWSCLQFDPSSVCLASSSQGEQMTEMDLATVRHVHNRQIDELLYRRARQFQIFTGTVVILLAMVGALVSAPDKALSHPAWPIVGTLFVLVLVGFSIRWQTAHQRDTAGHARVIVDILDRMGAFGEGPYLDKWKEWGTTTPSRRRIVMTALVGVLTLATIWLKYLSEGTV
jgi:hypothetical protein